MHKKRLSIRLDESISGHVQKKWKCPSCGQKRFVRFYDFEKSDYLDEKFGRCDRADNCGYYLSPYSDESFKPGKAKFEKSSSFVPEPVKINYVDKDIVAKTLDRYNENNFVQFLIKLVGTERAMQAAFKFFIGTAKGNGTIFWQVDNFMMVRTGSKIFYKTDGHRDKNNLPSKLFKIENDYRACLFGLHQLFTVTGDFLIMIVESEKTAVFGSLYMPDVVGRRIVWMAASGSNGLTAEKIAPLRGRDVCLVPDFSFHARATWGLVPMRKKYVEKIIKGESKLIYLPHPDGELVEYESAADRLRAIGCAVSFFDPLPNVDDGSDIADTFVVETAPDEIIMPDFTSLLIEVGETDGERSEIKPYNQLSLSERIQILSGRHSFKLIRRNDATFEIRTNNDDIKEIIEEKLLKHAGILELIKKFDIESGSVNFGCNGGDSSLDN